MIVAWVMGVLALLEPGAPLACVYLWLDDKLPEAKGLWILFTLYDAQGPASTERLP